MKIVSYYIGRTLLSMVGLVVLLLATMELFIIFIGQLKDIGVGNFTVFKAFLYALMQVPYQIYLFFPIACLLGALIGLGLLAQNSELIVLQTSGVSRFQIAMTVLKSSFVVLILSMIIGEGLVPRLLAYSEQHKSNLTSGGQSLQTQAGLWARVQNHFIHINSVFSGTQLLGLSDYVFDEKQKLVQTTFAKSASYQHHHWELHDAAQTNLGESSVSSSHFLTLQWPVPLDRRVLIFNMQQPEQLRLNDLYHYIRSQHKNFISTTAFELNFWQRLAQPLSTCVMMLLSIPFIFGPLRSVSMGSRLLAGASVGFVFHIINRFFGPVSLAFHLSPFFAAIAPTVFFSLFALWLLQRKSI